MGEQVIVSNEVAKNDFNTDKSGVTHEKTKEIFNGLVRERALEFSHIKEKMDPNNLVLYIQDLWKLANRF